MYCDYNGAMGGFFYSYSYQSGCTISPMCNGKDYATLSISNKQPCCRVLSKRALLKDAGTLASNVSNNEIIYHYSELKPMSVCFGLSFPGTAILLTRL